MNKQKLLYTPVFLYTVLLVGVWVTSWIAGVQGLLSSGVQRNNSLLSVSGIRWALRTATESLEAAPWGTAVLCVTALGLLFGSGFMDTLHLIFTGQKLSYNRRLATIVSVTLFLLWIVLFLVGVIAQWYPLAGVTAHLSSSPLVMGVLLVVFMAILTVTSLYGAISGYYRSLSDLLDGVCAVFARSLPAFLAMLPASGLIPSLSYVGITLPEGVEFAIYFLPFVFVLFFSVRFSKE